MEIFCIISTGYTYKEDVNDILRGTNIKIYYFSDMLDEWRDRKKEIKLYKDV